eukprot:7403035-Karenia_brevis.AAC.1
MSRTAGTQVRQARDILRPERPQDPWTELYVQKGSKSFKLFINLDASEQQQRLQAIQRKTKDAFKELHPGLSIGMPKPQYAPNMPMQGVITINQQNAVVISADTKHGPHRLQFDPQQIELHKLSQDAIKARVEQLLTRASRVVDTAGWLGRALFHSDTIKRSAKINFLMQQSSKFDILVILEAHGNRHDFARLQHRMKDFK